VDVGRRSDFTAITIIQRKDELHRTIHFEVLREMSFGEQRERICALVDRFSPNALFIDETGIGMQISEELREKYSDIVHPLTFTNENKGEMMAETKRLLEMKRLSLVEDPPLLNALNMIRRTQAGNSVKYESDRTDEFGHADAAWSLALAVYAAMAPIEPFTVPEPLRL